MNNSNNISGTRNNNQTNITSNLGTIINPLSYTLSPPASPNKQIFTTPITLVVDQSKNIGNISVTVPISSERTIQSIEGRITGHDWQPKDRLEKAYFLAQYLDASGNYIDILNDDGTTDEAMIKEITYKTPASLSPYKLENYFTMVTCNFMFQGENQASLGYTNQIEIRLYIQPKFEKSYLVESNFLAYAEINQLTFNNNTDIQTNNFQDYAIFNEDTPAQYITDTSHNKTQASIKTISTFDFIPCKKFSIDISLNLSLVAELTSGSTIQAGPPDDYSLFRSEAIDFTIQITDNSDNVLQETTTQIPSLTTYRDIQWTGGLVTDTEQISFQYNVKQFNISFENYRRTTVTSSANRFNYKRSGGPDRDYTVPNGIYSPTEFIAWVNATTDLSASIDISGFITYNWPAQANWHFKNMATGAYQTMGFNVPGDQISTTNHIIVSELDFINQHATTQTYKVKCTQINSTNESFWYRHSGQEVYITNTSFFTFGIDAGSNTDQTTYTTTSYEKVGFVPFYTDGSSGSNYNTITMSGINNGFRQDDSNLISLSNTMLCNTIKSQNITANQMTLRGKDLYTIVNNVQPQMMEPIIDTSANHTIFVGIDNFSDPPQYASQWEERATQVFIVDNTTYDIEIQIRKLLNGWSNPTNGSIMTFLVLDNNKLVKFKSDFFTMISSHGVQYNPDTWMIVVGSYIQFMFYEDKMILISGATGTQSGGDILVSYNSSFNNYSIQTEEDIELIFDWFKDDKMGFDKPFDFV